MASRIRMSPSGYSTMDYMLGQSGSLLARQESASSRSRKSTIPIELGLGEEVATLDHIRSEFPLAIISVKPRYFLRTEIGLCLSIPPSGNSQGIRNLPGSPKVFWVYLFQDDRREINVIHTKFEDLVSGSLKFEYISKDMEEKLRFRVGTSGTRYQKEATMGSRTGVVIGLGPTGGWTGAVLCEQEGCIGPLFHLGFWLSSTKN
ncbi:hypothetical protein Tco_0717624 [Tanacetum coccineum]